MAKARSKGKGTKGVDRELVRFSARIFRDQLDALERHERETGVPATRMVRDAIDAELARRGIKHDKGAR